MPPLHAIIAARRRLPLMPGTMHAAIIAAAADDFI